ncbi:MAG: alpha/beta fold hydrolase [Actinomycetota bacterium]
MGAETTAGGFGPSDVPPTRFAQARGARIAYQDFGTGPAVIAVPPMAQNIEIAWEWPAVRSMFDRFGSFSRWIQFDKRGTGASDRRSRVPGLDERVDDLRAVMDDAGVARGFLYGASEGGPMCVLFAATYPDRVAGLILHGTTACYNVPDRTAEELADLDRRTNHLADVWGTADSVVPQLFAPSLAGDPEFRRWFERYERLAADRDSLRELLYMLRGFDVRELLPQITVPTLILHRTGDQVIPVSEARDLAEAIPQATLVVDEGDDHFAFAGDQSWLNDLERFVTGSVQQRPTTEISETARSTVRITTLGRFSVSVDGEEVPTSAWGSRLPRRLCKRLIAARGWPVTREELFELFWPDEHDPQKLGARLSVQLSAVRRVLRGAIIADRQTVALNLAEVSVDLEEFFTAAPDDAVRVYGADFLIEDRAEDWTNGVRDEARARFTVLAKSLIGEAADDGDHQRAAELARRLITTDPYDEDGHRALTGALIAGGQLGDARRAHEAWRSAMAELDVPAPDFDDLLVDPERRG